MMLFKRRRLYIWLLKAYFRKWRRTIGVSFVFGLVIFFILRYASVYFVKKIPFTTRENIGIVGAYTTDSLPEDVLSKISRGLTKVSPDGSAAPDIAKKWEIKDNGKTYVFHLKNGVVFSDGTPLTSDKIKYNFLDVKEERPNKQTIIFKLKESYSPFLITVSRPIFKDNYVGLGEFKVKKIRTNGDFVESIDLASAKNDYSLLSYQMYPTEEALKIAFILGEVSNAKGLTDIKFKDSSLDKYKNIEVSKVENDQQLVTLFYNNSDQVLSDKKVRQALTYALPNEFIFGKRTRFPFPASSWVSQGLMTEYEQDLVHAKNLFSKASGSSSAALKLNLQTTKKYETLAKEIQKSWNALGVKTTIYVVPGLLPTYQIFLGDFKMPRDPDQYTLWHSDQDNNITHYKNLRIDKLLEDGRKTTDQMKRQKLYYDFQKYLLDDSPATFLYFPYQYDLRRN